MGPLQGVKVLEFAGLGAAPLGAMLLADLGAEVLCIERLAPAAMLFDPARDILRRNRRIVGLDLKRPEGLAAARRLAAEAEILVEGFRPGVMEKLGLGPEALLAANPRLVYGRITGWGQHGPLAQEAGHDIDYLALTGALSAIGEPGGKPVLPLNLVADGGGAFLLALGVLAALVAARSTGRGQVVDAAMCDAASLSMAMIHTLKAMGEWSQRRGDNVLDGGAPFYDSYRCADGRYLALGPLEPHFFAQLLERLGLADIDPGIQWQRERWPELRRRLAERLATRSRDEWCELLAGSDSCVAPVLDLDEAPRHPHNRARDAFVEVGGVVQPAPAPRFSATPAGTPRPPENDGAGALSRWGFDDAQVAALRAAGAMAR